MNTIEVVVLVIAFVVTVVNSLLLYDMKKRVDMLRDRMGTLALKVSDIDHRIERVDESMGVEVSKLSRKFEKFEADYGEAAIEEKREAARAEKAWADGVNSIMSYGSRLQGRGGTE